MTGTGPSFDVSVLIHPGRPNREIIVAVLHRMVSNREPVITFTQLEDGGKPVPADRPAKAIVEAWEGYPSPSFGVKAKGRGNTLVIFTRDFAGDLQGGLQLIWKLEPALADGFVDLLADLSVRLSSPLAVLSHDDVAGRPGWRGRQNSHKYALREALHSRAVRYGLFRGLAGVAHRTVLGDELVAMFGEERVASLPAELAFRHTSGRWVLTPTEDPLDWTCDEWCPGEAAIIQALGPEHFYNPATKALPSVVPELPKVAPYPCRTRDPETNEWLEHNR